jgi:hypothetical protein
MRRVSFVSRLAALVVVGHLAYHLAPRLAPSPGVTQARVGPAPVPAVVETASVIARSCRLQPPLATQDGGDPQPMLAALRQLIAREEERYPYLASNDDDLLRRFELCPVGRARRR